jgi:hypothetical protein
MKITLTELPTPKGGCQIYRPYFRDMSLQQIEDELQEDFKSYSDVGYNSFTFCRAVATISIRRIEIKTIQDILETDQYGLLND